MALTAVVQYIVHSALEELDATYDSDNEADYTKMDMVCVGVLIVTSCDADSMGVHVYIMYICCVYAC